MTKFDVLKKHYGHTSFRPAQEALIDALLSERDVLGIMPTGAGKSICYQIPAMMLSGVTIVVSPLISLMKDQVAQLRQADLPVAYLNSSLTVAQSQEALRRANQGRYKIIYVAPERLTSESFIDFAQETDISLIAVDEAHCVSQWGQDFRPGYLRISNFVDALPKRPIIGAFTATATTAVKRDIIRLLKLNEPLNLTTGFDRPNLYFEVATPKDKLSYLYELIGSRKGACGIIYCSTRKIVESVCSKIERLGISVTRYHAGLDSAERQRNQDDFISGKADIIVATNAFGMGIDKPNVRFVIHYNMPKNMESYYQEAGRAGRDGNPSECILLFSEDDIKTAEYFMKSSEKNKDLTEKERRIVGRRDIESLEKMVRYCEMESCLRVYMLRYFGEKMKGTCQNCSNCNRPAWWQIWRRNKYSRQNEQLVQQEPTRMTVLGIEIR